MTKKQAVICGVLTFLVLSSLFDSNKSDNNTGVVDEPSTSSTTSSLQESNSSFAEISSKVGLESSTIVSSEVSTDYCTQKSVALNSLINSYNKIAPEDIQITPDMIVNGVGRETIRIELDSIIVGLNDLKSEHEILLTLRYNGTDDSELKTVFGVFCCAQKSEISESEVNSVWQELQTGRHSAAGYHPYDFSGIKCCYDADLLQSGKEYSYVVRTSSFYENTLF